MTFQVLSCTWYWGLGERTPSATSVPEQSVTLIRNCGEYHSKARLGEQNLSAHGDQEIKQEEQEQELNSDLPPGPNS